ncbi:ferredoxin [Gordonia polyisoprenivorans]|nr:ferredoxin [Gordonia polyisoprenivorans]QTI69088.1 ferredoxin [Gordonia polyisoprenivorans]
MCLAVAPEHFAFTGGGRAVGTKDVVGTAELQLVVDAAKACPARAITITDRA